MKNVFHRWIPAFFLLLSIVSLAFYFTTGEKTYSDQAVQKLSSELQAHMMAFIKKKQRATVNFKRGFASLTCRDLTSRFLEQYALKQLKRNADIRGVMLLGRHFHFLFVRDAKLWAAAYDTIFNDTLTNWVRLNSHLQIVGRWAGNYRYFIDETSLKKTNLLVRSVKQLLWILFSRKGITRRDFILFSNYARLKDGKTIVFALVYNLHEQDKAFFPLLQFPRAFVSIVAPFEKFTVPLYVADTSSGISGKPVVDQINRLLESWERPSGPGGNSYLFIQNSKRYWLHVSLLPRSPGIRAVASATAKKELETLAGLKKNLYGYASVFFVFVAFLLVLFTKKR